MARILSTAPTGREISDAVNGILDGRSNNYGSFTLTASVGTTVVSDRRVGTNSVITVMPCTGNAAAEVPTLYIATITAASFTVSHANNAQTDRDFKYEVTG